MDTHTLDLLEYHRIREIVSGFAACSLGKELALAMQPAAEESVVRRLLKATAEMTDCIARDRAPPLGGLHDIRPLLDAAEAGSLLSAEDLARISETVFCFTRTRIWLDKLPAAPEYPLTHELGRKVGRFGDLADEIDKSVDASGKVHDTASSRLLKLRTELEARKHELSEKIRDYISNPTIKSYLQFPQATWSGDRFVLPVKADMRGRIPGIVHRSSASGETAFVEPAAAVEMGNAIQDLIGQEQQEITRILRDLTRRVAGEVRALRRTVETLAEFDLLAAKARFGLEYRAVEPEVTSDGSLRLRGARHPLLMQLARQSQPPREVVPIDVHLGEQFDVLIITGPNTGGKTVSLKTVALLALMAQSGLFVTAGHGARVPAFSGVFADIGDEQSIQQSLSTYSSHIRRIAEILGKTNERTLVILDELGSGTDPAEGAALGRAILDELIRLRCKAMVTTHLGSLKTYAYAGGRAENASVEFDVQTLRPTYRLLIGEPGNSNALTIAERLGMNAGVLFRARRYLTEADTSLSRTIDEIRVQRRAAEVAKQAAEESEAAAAKAKKEYEAKLDQLAGQKRQEEDRDQWRAKLQPGDKIYVPRFGSTGQFLRYVGAGKAEASVQVGYMQVRLPVAQIHPPESAEA